MWHKEKDNTSTEEIELNFSLNDSFVKYLHKTQRIYFAHDKK